MSGPALSMAQSYSALVAEVAAKGRQERENEPLRKFTKDEIKEQLGSAWPKFKFRSVVSGIRMMFARVRQGHVGYRRFKLSHADRFPDKVLLRIFSFLPHRDLLRCARVCRKWRTIACDSRLWSVVSLRPDYGGLTVHSVDDLLALMSVRMGPNLRWIELPIDLITLPVLQELANKCPKLRYLTLDFTGAVQLHDFQELSAFPARLRTLIICLSEVIFLENFARKIYSFIGSVEILHLIGTYENVNVEDEAVYEVISISRLKAYTPNLTVVNFFGVLFVTDEHIEGLSATCVHIECLALSFCQKFTGTSLKILFERCRKLRSLMMEQCTLISAAVMSANWSSVSIEELNVSATDLSPECIALVLTRTPNLRWLSASYLEHFNDQVLNTWMESGSGSKLKSIDLNTSDSLTPNCLLHYLEQYGRNLIGLNLGGNAVLVEAFWMSALPLIPNMQILVMGVEPTCCRKVESRILVDQVIVAIAELCPRLERVEIRWDSDTLRFSDRSSKFLDVLRLRCVNLKTFTLSDGSYFELVRSNFQRAGRWSVPRTTTCYQTSMVTQLAYYHDLIFN